MYDYQKSAEAVLIRRAKRGDVKAFSELYSRIYVELYKFVTLYSEASAGGGGCSQ